MKIRVMILLLALCICVASMVSAAALHLPHYVTQEQTIGDDVYLAGETVTVKGKVIGDLLAIAKSIIYTGNIAADLLVIGLQADLGGTVNDDIRSLALQTNLRGLVGDDAVLAGFKVNLDPSSRIGHMAVVTAGQAVINGTVQGDLIITGYNCIIGGDIRGNVTASVANLQLTPTTHIRGNLTYSSKEPVVVPPGAVIEGQLIQAKPAVSHAIQYAPSETKWNRLLGMIAWDTSLMMAGILLMFLVPQTIRISCQTMTVNPGITCIYGFCWLVGAPVVASLGVLSVIGLPIAIATVFLYLSSLYLSSLPVALWIGEKIFRSTQKPYASLAIGLLLISLLRSLPYIGIVVSFITLTMGLGSLSLSFRNYVWSKR